MLAAWTGPVGQTLATRNAQRFDGHANSAIDAHGLARIQGAAIIFAAQSSPIVGTATKSLVTNDHANAAVEAVNAVTNSGSCCIG